MVDDNNLITGCPVGRALDVVGDTWSILILRDAHAGLSRFDQFRKNLGIAPTMLTKRLGALTSAGLLEKRCYCERPPREEYVLTEAGKDFLPVLMMIGAWAQRHCKEKDANGESIESGKKLARYIDAETGLEIQPVCIDSVTGAKLGSRPIRFSEPGDAA